MLTPQQMAARVVETLGAGMISSSMLEGLHPWIAVSPEHWPQVGRFLRDDKQLRLDWLRCITGLDYPDKKQLCLAYDLISYEHRHELCVKVFVSRDEPVVPSMADVWRAAEWHEREAYDLLGFRFTGNPDSVTDQDGTHPRRILLPDDWKGYPLRKDYAFPKEYQGIPGTVETEWAQKPDYPK